MKIRLAVAVAASCVGLGACTTAGGTPATAPDVTTTLMTTTEPVAATTTADQPATTTTLDRIAEIEAIFQDLEVRRLQAIMDQDEDAFRAVFANEEYAERSLGGMVLVTVIDPSAAVFTVREVFVDETDCIAVSAVTDGSKAVVGADIGESSDYVLEARDGSWGFSWAGSGWRCDGPHPFSG